MEPKYKRLLIKLSGEALAGSKGFGIDMEKVNKISESIKVCSDMGAEIGIVVGGGNFWRGRTSENMDRTRADHMGMLATVINSLALADPTSWCPCRSTWRTTLPRTPRPSGRRWSTW